MSHWNMYMSSKVFSTPGVEYDQRCQRKEKDGAPLGSPSGYQNVGMPTVFPLSIYATASLSNPAVKALLKVDLSLSGPYLPKSSLRSLSNLG